MVRHAVRGRDRHRSDVLRSGRAARPFPESTTGCRSCGPCRRAPARDRLRHLPLGRARLGDVRGRRARSRLRGVQPRIAPDAAVGLLSDSGRSGVGPVRPRHRHSRRIRHAVWLGDVARPRSRTNGGGAGPPVRRAGYRRDQGAVDQRHHGHRDGLGGRGDGSGDQAAEPGQPAPGPGAACLCPCRRTHPRSVHGVRRQHRPLCRGYRTAQLVGRARRFRLPARMDHLLLGVVALVDALRRHVHCAGFAGTHGARSRRLHADHAGARLRALDERVRGDRAVALSRRGPHRRGRGGAGATTGNGPVPDA